MSHARPRTLIATVLAAGSLAVGPAGALAQQPAPPPGPLVAMDFPDDGIDLALLADLVTRRLHVPILYDDQLVRGKKVVVRVPTKVPESALLGILQSALRLKQLALVDAEQPGWKQIVPAASLAAVARPVGGANPGDGPIAQAFLLEHADPGKLVELVRPFLTQPGGYVQAEVRGRRCCWSATTRRSSAAVAGPDRAARRGVSPAVETRFVPLRPGRRRRPSPRPCHATGRQPRVVPVGLGHRVGSGVSLSGRRAVEPDRRRRPPRPAWPRCSP